MIPQDKTEAVTRALRETFGVTGAEDIRSLTGGNDPSSALAFRIVVRGSAFLLRIHQRKGDFPRHVSCMKAAAEAGLAPRVWYANIEDKVYVTDLVEPAPFPLKDALVRTAATLRALHALPPFDPQSHFNTTCTFLFNKGPALDGFLQGFQAKNFVPKDECEEAFEGFARTAAIYPNDGRDLVSSHNDLKPANILFDGTRIWLVDWEAAFRNDRYSDLAMVAHSVVSNDEDERIYLQEYFGHPPNDYHLARHFVMRQLAHMFYGMGYMLFGASGKPEEPGEKTPDFREIQKRVWAGEERLGNPLAKFLYGKAHWEHCLRGMRRERFSQAVKIIGAGG